jgi:hypothetical protein
MVISLSYKVFFSQKSWQIVVERGASMKYDQTWDILEEALGRIKFMRDVPPDWRSRFALQRRDDENYARLDIYTYNVNTYKPDEMRLTRHEFVVPVTTYNLQAWVRWVFDRIRSIDLHETTESFLFDDERIYAPHHGNGWDPYSFWPGHDISEKKKAPGES